MKHIHFLAPMAFAAIVLASCGQSTPKASMNNNVDSLSFAIGNANSQGLNQFLAQQGIDSAYADDVIEGMVKGFNEAEDKKKAAYNMGIGLGMQIDQMFKGMSQQVFAGDTTQTLSRQNFIAGVVAGAKGEPNIMEPAAMERLFTSLMEQNSQKLVKENKDFLAANAKKAGVKTTESGLQYKVLKQGKGHIPSDSTQVRLHYEGRTIDGKVFDSSYKNHGDPIVMQPRQFIPGFCEALTMMPTGSTWEIYIPAELAYGNQQMRDIRPNSTLIFKVELISIVAEEKNNPTQQQPIQVQPK
ncbi:MAG: FKBP-type peptidyl-prolyl cis-trans isomerase [Bacteroidaceae bacterium]|nr:FKBP-type peptidyl-prolyl cis-trans isomerase [Bacteroidaceae bacterium]